MGIFGFSQKETGIEMLTCQQYSKSHSVSFVMYISGPKFEDHWPNISRDKTKLIARLVLQQKGKIYWPIFQLAELVFFRAST